MRARDAIFGAYSRTNVIEFSRSEEDGVVTTRGATLGKLMQQVEKEAITEWLTPERVGKALADVRTPGFRTFGEEVYAICRALVKDLP
jgi:hypothetical protein